MLKKRKIIVLVFVVSLLPVLYYWQTNRSLKDGIKEVTIQVPVVGGVHENDIRFTGKVMFRPVDKNGDNLVDFLVAEVEVEILVSGEYKVLGVLKKGGRIIANTPAFESMLFSDATIDQPPGVYTVSIMFSGGQIFHSRRNGPFDLELFAIGENSNVALTAQTPAYRHRQFREVRDR